MDGLSDEALHVGVGMPIHLIGCHAWYELRYMYLHRLGTYSKVPSGLGLRTGPTWAGGHLGRYLMTSNLKCLLR